MAHETDESLGTFEALRESGVVAVMRGGDPDTVIDTVDALVAGGVTAIEITADTDGASDLIAEVNASVPEAVVGAGTVLDSETARACLLAGAEFVVSPSLHADVIETANRYGALVAPGIMTPTEAIRGYEAGADLVKVFPASTLGPGHLSSMKGPLGQIPMMPTGGVDLDNVADFVEAGAVCVGAGSSLVDYDAVERGDPESITETAREFRERIEAARE
ncbi:2-keto-3-deoxy-6-phosphogluconate aldolase [Halalkaliarchaeum sp. AArc-CO]|uniref:bifunctional 4-hydroxy-2-oxoglutarate aldolase/2-dehydro-3-deoxy-phosphogluconate aldolase n=1 Tax=unclassified Halalkaliarchaeum TaxID=2678344 RepID=UPI00217DD7A7|nr:MULTISPECIES: bifunctional 4-hydroxy-2-oxoglutarate aldolase/2-dehydro-3-deoxy-phosphogluconate aldolase [unclassified Halalkaliarchaeum]MDR5672281.1 bifunctional 4-hydroxy-2-oxoglutarate aldolase/2-dehydro-3-deoxy-phosphogluconate aldolase [Halalkaliarchaeum sp. AArc-GB]UWG50102.1 2-keto-3-deoxy-6-phosphogluconate aldolase [Halalkaliarchaeum sp. AArc-CO]